MFDNISIPLINSRQSQHSCGALRRLFGEHRSSIEEAAALLAGVRGIKLASRIADELAMNRKISQCCRRDLQALLDVFSLENVHDPDRDEASFFAALDPGSHAVEEICLLTDTFRDALDQADLDTPPASRTRTAA